MPRAQVFRGAQDVKVQTWWSVGIGRICGHLTRHLLHHLVTGKATASFPTLALAEEKLFEDIGLLLACDIMIALQLERGTPGNWNGQTCHFVLPDNKYWIEFFYPAQHRVY